MALYAKNLTAAFADFVYVQDISGIRIVTRRPIAGLIDLAGLIQTVDGERVICADTVVPTSP